MTLLFAAVRAAHFLSLMAAFGAAAFLALLEARALPVPPEKMTRIFFPAAAVTSLITAVLWFFLVTGRMAGDWRATFDPATLRLVAGATQFGQIAVWRIAGLVLLLGQCLSPARDRKGAMATLAAVLLASLGLTSHAAAAAGAFALLRAVNDATHLLAAGFWAGGLVILAGLVRRHYRQPQMLEAPFRLFSRWGTLAVALLIASGLVNAASILPVRSLSTDNAYADVLAVKITLALLMVVLAVVNRLELVPALGSRREKVVRQLDRSVLAEILLGVLVIGIVGYLGQMAPS